MSISVVRLLFDCCGTCPIPLTIFLGDLEDYMGILLVSISVVVYLSSPSLTPQIYWALVFHLYTADYTKTLEDNSVAATSLS